MKPPRMTQNGPYLRIRYYDRNGHRRSYGVGLAAGTTQEDQDAALAEFIRRQGAEPGWPDERIVEPDSLTVAGLVEAFLEAKARERESGRIGARMLMDYRHSAALLLKGIEGGTRLDALTPADFGRLRVELAGRLGLVALKNAMIRIRGIWKWGRHLGIAGEPWGPEFGLPRAREMRLARAARPEPTFTAGEIRTLLEAASPMMRAMILLGVNCGLGNADVAGLEAEMIRGRVLDYPRPKTGMPRRSILWPETVAAVNGAGGAPFRTRQGRAWSRVTEGGTGKAGTVMVRGGVIDPLGQAFAKLCRSAGLQRAGRGFYALRHTFRTVADGAGDPRAVDLVMGHETPGMGTTYVHGVSDARLVRVSEFVRGWLWSKTGPKPVGKRKADRIGMSGKPARKRP